MFFEIYSNSHNVSLCFPGRSSEMISQLEQLIFYKVEQNERDEGQLESDLRRMRNYVLYMRNLLDNGNDDEIMNMYDHLVRYLNDTRGRNPFWLDADNQERPTVSLKSEAGEDVLNSSVDHLVTKCLGELTVPNLQADNFELVGERGKVTLNTILDLYYILYYIVVAFNPVNWARNTFSIYF